jgi:hypothetical protein
MWTLLLGTISCGVVVSVAVLLWVPISQESSGYTMIGSQPYSYVSAELPSSGWMNVSYRGVQFEFAIPTCPRNTGGGVLCGSTVQADGTAAPFDLELPPSAPQPTGWLTWLSPDRHVAIEVETNSNTPIHLLVAE